MTHPPDGDRYPRAWRKFRTVSDRDADHRHDGVVRVEWALGPEPVVSGRVAVRGARRAPGLWAQRVRVRRPAAPPSWCRRC